MLGKLYEIDDGQKCDLGCTWLAMKIMLPREIIDDCVRYEFDDKCWIIGLYIELELVVNVSSSKLWVGMLWSCGLKHIIYLSWVKLLN